MGIALLYGPRDVGLGHAHRLGQRPAARQVCGDGRGVSATGAVGVLRVDPLAGEHLYAIGRDEDVRRPVRQQMPTLDQHGAGPVLQKLPTGVFSVSAGPHLSLCQRLRLVHVGSDDGGQGKEFFSESALGLVCQQSIARLGDHDRVQDEEWRPVLAQGGGDRLDYGAGRPACRS